MKISSLLTDEAILIEIGSRLARRRLDLQLTQAQLAEQAGVAKRTVERIEAGGSSQLASLIRIFRVLDLLPGLEQLLPQALPGPLDMLKRQGKQRQRATGRRRAPASDEPWSWGDDT